MPLLPIMWGLMSAQCEAEEPACRHSRARARHVIETYDWAMKALIRQVTALHTIAFPRSALQSELHELQPCTVKVLCRRLWLSN